MSVELLCALISATAAVVAWVVCWFVVAWQIRKALRSWIAAASAHLEDGQAPELDIALDRLWEALDEYPNTWWRSWL